MPNPVSDSHGIVILARMDSARLPGKPLADAGGVPLIGRVVERLRAGAADLGPIVLATTDRPVDEPLAAWAVEAGIPCHRQPGPPDDVAGRFVDAATAHGLEWAFRVNGDSPMVDAGLLARALERAGAETDLVTNLRPRRHPYGMAVELVRVSSLARLRDSETLDADDREHVTTALYRQLAPARIASVGGGTAAWAEVQTTVDTAEDLARFVRFVDDHAATWPRTPIQAVVPPAAPRNRRMITLFCIHPHGFNVGNDAIHVALRSMIDGAFGQMVNLISVPATTRFESHGRAGLTASMVHEINQYGDGVIVGGGNLIENGQLDVDTGALAALGPPMMMFSLSRGRIHDRRGDLVDRTDVMPDATIRALHDASMSNVVRDRATYDHCVSIGCQGVELGGCPTTNLADLGGVLPPVHARDREGLFISVRNPSLMNIPLHAQARVRGQVESYAAMIRDATGESPRLLCHDHRDIPFAASFPDLDYVYTGDVHRFLALLRAARLVISYRLHASIPCLAFGTPFVNVSYDERASSVMETIGLDAWNVDLMREDPVAGVADRIQRLPELDVLVAASEPRRDDLRRVMSGAIDRFRDAVLDFSGVRDIQEQTSCSSIRTAAST